jgi:AraC-like DNA-binding protein
MPEPPPFLTDPPETPPTDVLTDLLETLRQDTLVYGSFDLGAPWGIRLPDDDWAYLIVTGRGSWVLAADGAGPPVTVSAGDLLLLPHGGGHILRDGAHTPVRVVMSAGCAQVHETLPVRLGGDGPRTTLVLAAFRFRPAHRSVSIHRLPPMIHVPCGHPASSPGLTSALALLVAESSSGRPGASVVMSRLADILLIEAIRVQIATRDCAGHGLRALGDEQIGRALTLIHRHPDRPWTVDRLASAVALSRSAFAGRFTSLVGTAPAEYLGRWRMTKAAQLLRAGELTTGEIARRSGYRSEAAFNRAFKRLEGTPPGAYRRAARER